MVGTFVTDYYVFQNLSKNFFSLNITVTTLWKSGMRITYTANVRFWQSMIKMTFIPVPKTTQLRLTSNRCTRPSPSAPSLVMFNPRTLASGDFHPRDCAHMIFIVLLLSELHGSLSSFSLLTDVIEGRRNRVIFTQWENIGGSIFFTYIMHMC